MGRAYSQSTGLRTLGVWAAFWGVACAAAGTSFGAILGFVAGWGVLILAVPLMLIGQLQLAPLLLMAVFVVFILYGAFLIVRDFLRHGFAHHDYSGALSGLHKVGVCAALLLSFGSLSNAFA